jgi:UDPglucose 6-dehydrogenase
LAGCGFGGSCLPKDLNALRAFAREQGLSPHLLDAVMQINGARPATLVGLAEAAVGALHGAKIAVLGLAFKAGTDDLRESPALSIIALLRERRAVVTAYDPIVKEFPPGTGIERLATMCTTPQEAVRGADAALVTMAGPEFAAWDWPRLCALMRRPIVVDGRNSLASVAQLPGVCYITIGRLAQTAQPGSAMGLRWPA